jgi:hypothetical protein
MTWLRWLCRSISQSATSFCLLLLLLLLLHLLVPSTAGVAGSVPGAGDGLTGALLWPCAKAAAGCSSAVLVAQRRQQQQQQEK